MTRHGVVATVGRWQPPIVVVFIWAFLGVGTMVCAWSFATPIGAAPDEPNHLAQAVAVVRGQFDEPTHLSALGELATVRVPGWAGDNNIPCFLQADIVTICIQLRGGTVSRPFRQHDEARFHNDPVLERPTADYLVAGVPSLFLGESAVYAMRVIADLLNALPVAVGHSAS